MKDDVFQMNREFFYKIAQENTRKNRYGQTTISRTDEDFYDDDWEEAYRKMSSQE